MELFSLKDKVIIVTGAAGLLGYEYCKAIIQAKGIPILIDIDETSINNKVKELNENFPDSECMGFIVDITNEELIKKNCSDILNIYGKID